MNSTAGSRAKDLEGFEAGGFLKQYLEYAGRLTDAPAEYHLFTALTVLGAAASHVRISYGAHRLAPALWTVLVGAGPFYRKTTAIEIGRRVLAAAHPAAAPPVIYSHERVIDALTNTDRLLAIEDFGDLLYAVAARRLAEFGDAGPQVSLLSAASPALLSAVAVLAGGARPPVVARFAFVVPAEKRQWRAMPGAPDPAAEAHLAEFLKRAARIEGEALFAARDGELREWGAAALDWVNRRRDSAMSLDAAAGVLSRLEPALLKLAALIEISAAVGGDAGEAGTASALRVSAASFRAACCLERYLRASFERLQSSAAAESHYEARLLARIMRAPGITRRRLQQNSHLDGGTLGQELRKLVRDGRVAVRGNRLYHSASSDRLIFRASEALEAGASEAPEAGKMPALRPESQPRPRE